MVHPVVISHIQARSLLNARLAGNETTLISLDLGLTMTQVQIDVAGVVLMDGQIVGWETIDTISEDNLTCFVIEESKAHKIQSFSAHSNRVCSLMPTSTVPTLLIAGFPMHRFKGIDPRQDTIRKVRTVAPVRGAILDTSTGLGYTAIEASRTASHVVTIEVDPTVLEIARLNPWSQTLFEHPAIEQIIGNSYDEITAMPDATFSRIIHDPPTFQLAGELYSAIFYRQLRRVLRENGRLFHYIGDLESKSGRSVGKGVVRRLKEAGFERIIRKPAAFGVVAYT